MDSEIVSRANKIVLAILGVLILGLLIIFFCKTKDRENELKRDLYKNHEIIESKYDFGKWVADSYSDKMSLEFIKDEDIKRLSMNDYEKIHISMWDVSYLTPEWFDIYYASPIVYGKYLLKTPQDICEYLKVALESNPNIDSIYIGIDPYELYKNYYTSVYYDSEILTYEEYLENNLFTIFKEYSNVNFRIFLPVKPLSVWAELEDSEIEQTFRNWSIFLMYLRLYPNVKTVYMGTQEWLVSSDLNFSEGMTLADDIGKLMHLYMYDKNDYIITPPEINNMMEVMVAMVFNKRSGMYDYQGIEDQKIVFWGDSLLCLFSQDSLTIPGYVSALTKADCYNLAVGGATASDGHADSFADVISKLSQGEATGRDAGRFIEDISRDTRFNIVVEYGLNDYLRNTGADRYGEGLEKGIKQLKERYPNSRIYIIAPYQISATPKDDDLELEDYDKLGLYVKIAEEVATEEEVGFINLYEESGITANNCREYLIDELHPSYNTNLYLAKIISETLVNQ